eukprot:TRINITY_DN5838_c0_g1_i1.p1 TRINITY_DN5838_c0_g1~~TRINITY_DN5838_c0_g1_i1.p1  ORF type:complete len:614 (-),score=238.93 TRINITY_DN5838_c0_g1_i1:23-1864(-)
MEVNYEERKTIGQIIDKITTPKKKTVVQDLDPELLQKIKTLGRKSDANLKCVAESLMFHMKSDSSNKRYLALLVMDTFFSRSKYFRSVLVQDLKDIMELTLGLRDSLPGPAHIATLLREKSLQLIEAWYKAHGKFLQPLDAGYNYLKHKMKLDFNATEETSKENERQKRAQQILMVKYTKTKEDMRDVVPDILNNLQQMDECFALLVPQFDENTVLAPDSSDSFESQMASALDTSSRSPMHGVPTHPSSDEDDIGGGFIPDEEDGGGFLPEEYSDEDRSFFQESGVGNNNYELDIEIKTRPGQRSEFLETLEPVYNTLKDFYKLLCLRHIHLISEWKDVLVRYVPMASEKVESENLLKQCIDLQQDVNLAKQKCENLGISELDIKALEAQYLTTYEDEEGLEMISIPLKIDETPSKDFLQVENQVENQVEEDELRDPVPTSHLSIKKTTLKSPEKSDEISKNSENSPPKYVPHFDSPAKISNLNSPAKSNGSISKEDLLKTAPVVPFFTGLSHWGEDQVMLPTQGLEREHRFLGNSSAPELETAKMEDLFLRKTYYQNKDFNPAPKMTPEEKEKIKQRIKDARKFLENSDSTVRERLKKKLHNPKELRKKPRK